MRIGAILLAGALGLTPAAGALGCNVNKISGTYQVQVVRTELDLATNVVETSHTTCWFQISRNRADVGNLNIACEDSPMFPYHDHFGVRFGPPLPWHQIAREGPQGGRIRTPNSCRWRIHDVAHGGSIDLAYLVAFSPDYNTVVGNGYGLLGWPPEIQVAVTLTGARQ